MIQNFLCGHMDIDDQLYNISNQTTNYKAELGTLQC